MDDAEITHKPGIHPITLSNWKTHFLDHGAEGFTRKHAGGDPQTTDCPAGTDVGLERNGVGLGKELIKKKLTRTEQVSLTPTWKDSDGLNRCLRAIGLAKSSWYGLRQSAGDGLSETDQLLHQRLCVDHIEVSDSERGAMDNPWIESLEERISNEVLRNQNSNAEMTAHLARVVL